jgi:hypothetical protein
MAVIGKYKIPMSKLAKHMTVSLAVSGICRFRARLQIAIWLVKLAAFVSGMRWEVLGKPIEE